jgi:hypothetical protein
MPGDYTNGLVPVARLGKIGHVVQGAPQGPKSSMTRPMTDGSVFVALYVEVAAIATNELSIPESLPKKLDELNKCKCLAARNNRTAGGRGHRRSSFRSEGVLDGRADGAQDLRDL